MATSTPSRTGVSPSSSPRLPSPPPFTEVQIGPKSPTVGDANSEFQLGDITQVDEGARRRIRPGTRASDMAAGPPLVDLNQLDSPFQLQEHLMALHFRVTVIPDSNAQVPVNKDTALLLAQPPRTSDTGEPVDRNLWLYELCRFLVNKANDVIISFFNESPPCSALTCPEMRASEWQYLCAVHDPPKSCAAIDYCCHTLDWAANILTSPKHFPSRLSLGGEGTNPANSMRQLVNIFRRVYRIFAHAWFQHRDMFWSVEGEKGIYIFFKTVCDLYQLIPDDNYTIPPEAEGLREDAEEDTEATPIETEAPDLMNGKFGKISIVRKEPEVTSPPQADAVSTTVSVGATTRRHKHTPSTGSHVTAIREESEDEEPEDGPGPEVTQVTTDDVATDETPAEADLAKGLGAMSLTQPQHPGGMQMEMPKFDVRAPEDPTPTGHDSPDPLAAAGKKQGEAAVASEEVSTTTTGKKGGVLDTILGHMDDPEKADQAKGDDNEDIGEPIEVPEVKATEATE